MSNDNKSIPSIDELISNDLSNNGNSINLDEFNLDNLSLDNLDSMLEKAPEPTKSKFDNVDITLDIDDMFSPADSRAGVGDNILDELDALSQAQSTTTSQSPSLRDVPNKADSIFEVSETFDATEADLLAPKEELASQLDGLDDMSSDGNKDDLPLAAIAPTPKPAKKSMFGSKSKDKSKSKRAARPPKAGKGNQDSKRLTMIVLGALVVLALLIGAWLFLNKGATGEAVSQVPVVDPATQAVEPPPEQTNETVETIETVDGTVEGEGLPDTSAIDMAVANAGTTDPNATAPNTGADATTVPPAPTQEMPMMNLDTSLIDVDAITQGEVPEDPALIKEEIDRLNDKDGQFAEQAKLIDEQLKMMQDLTKAKEEQIALLEAQIAQLEKEKGSK